MREGPFPVGLGLPVPQNVRFVSGSYAPVFQTPAPPIFHDSPLHESLPGSPGPGMVYVRQTSLPVLASKAATKPRIAPSPPPVPMMILSLTTSGAEVMGYP